VTRGKKAFDALIAGFAVDVLEIVFLIEEPEDITGVL
jgi:hypothetical protein